MPLKISDKIRHKLQVKHGVSEQDIIECFANREGRFLIDTREEHQTEPPTKWFIAETNSGRLLKVVFIQQRDGNDIFIKTAYQANLKEIQIYQKYGRG